ncbi:MAG: hypothetical protein LBG96_02950, partial [Tannerella sp.]|nr:hypothetical protein [Tannerella sp.]
SGDNYRSAVTWRFIGAPSVVTVEAVRAGAWRIPDQNKAILMFAGSNDRILDLQLDVNLKELGFDPAHIQIVRHNTDGSTQKLPVLPSYIRFEPEEAFVLEIQSVKEG